MKDYKYRVCVRCMTYNQKQYIQDALLGFCMQETSFPVVFTIVDDASTDGEPEFLKLWCKKNLSLNEDGIAYQRDMEYGELIFAGHKEKHNLFFAVLLLKFNHYRKGVSSKKLDYLFEWMDQAKYYSLCEGDDYWTNPRKLQQQVNFLDSHPDYTMCFHKADVKVESGDYSNKPNNMYDDLEEREYSGIELAQRWRVPTASVMYRSFIKPPRDKKLLTGDIPLQLQCASEGRVFCFAESMSVYRRTEGGASLRQYSRMQIIDRNLAYIHYFPKFKMVYEEYLTKQMGTLFFSKDFIEVIKIVIKRNALLKYLVVGICYEFNPTLKWLFIKLFKKQ